MKNAWQLPIKERFRLLKELLPTGRVSITNSTDNTMWLINYCMEISRLLDVIFGLGTSESAFYDPKYFRIVIGQCAEIEEFIIRFCHESSHHIQHVLYGQQFELTNFAQMLAYEKEACKLSWLVYKLYFKDHISIHYNSFRCYESKEDLAHLKNKAKQRQASARKKK